MCDKKQEHESFINTSKVTYVDENQRNRGTVGMSLAEPINFQKPISFWAVHLTFVNLLLELGDFSVRIKSNIRPSGKFRTLQSKILRAPPGVNISTKI